MIPIFEPYLEGNEKPYVLDCLDTNWISSQGQYIKDLESSLARYHGMNYGVVTSNCTTALHLALKILDIGPGDEVICPSLTFIAPANMVALTGAKLVLVDIDQDTLTIDYNQIEEKITDRSKAIIVVHQFGHAAHMDEIMQLSEKYNLKVIEDNAESIGGLYKGKLLGTIGHVSTYSFFGNKIITTGEGGALLTNDKNLAIKCKELRDHGMNHKKKYDHLYLGYNYRMTNMQAAVGVAQMQMLDKILKIRSEQMRNYYDNLLGINGFTLRKFSDWCSPVHWMMTLTLDKNYSRDKFISYNRDNGVECRPMISPVSDAKHFIDLFDKEDYPVSYQFSKQSVHLPSSTSLTRDQVNHICKVVRSFFDR